MQRSVAVIDGSGFIGDVAKDILARFPLGFEGRGVARVFHCKDAQYVDRKISDDESIFFRLRRDPPLRSAHYSESVGTRRVLNIVVVVQECRVPLPCYVANGVTY